jgi:hypothetical protein
MAMKMFYSLEEAAQKLGLSANEVKDLATEGKLQQFRDRDKLMFKREQVDAMAGDAGGGDSSSIDSGSIALAGEEDPSGSTGPTGTSPLGVDDEELSLSLDEGPGGSRGPGGSKGGSKGPGGSKGGSKGPSASKMGMKSPARPPAKADDPRQATGVSVFDADEVESADPMAQTQVTASVADDEELALAGVGSGSGLLDLTRESDDTSLGAELLDEIYPSTEGSSSANVETGEATSTDTEVQPTGAGSEAGSGIFDPGNVQSSSGLENLQSAESQAGPVSLSPMSGGGVEYDDPAGSGFSSGFLTGALVALFISFSVSVSSVLGSTSPMIAKFNEPNGLLIWCAIPAGISLLLGIIGFLVGKKFAR